MKLRVLDIITCLITVQGFNLAVEKDGLWKSVGYFMFFFGLGAIIELRARKRST